ncbi:MAG TPA: transketolase [Bacteroidota bacterium]|nr:transketolase [Bacteroidota bacterium]
MTEENKKELELLALKVREHIIRMSTDGGCFIGASLSCADIVVYLYKEVLNITLNTAQDIGRDYFFLSKGHDVPALYGTLAELGMIKKERLSNHLKPNDTIYWHPNPSIPGIEFHSGSLGHLLSVAIGVAYDIKHRKGGNRVFVVLGDGELNEGSVWEAALVASAFELDNLVAIVDRNEFQANVRTEKLIPLEPIVEKFRSFGWSCRRIDGHDFQSLETAFNHLPIMESKPSVIIADTVRGKGLPSIERRADRWFANFSKAEVEMLIQELHGNAPAHLTSGTYMVR